MIPIRARIIWFCFLSLAFPAFLPQVSQAWELQEAPIMTSWAQLVDTNAPLPEYPRPQMVRENWVNLNGIWEFQPGSNGDPVPTGQVLTGDILVPFPMESALSGVMQHHPRSWYRRTFTVPPAWSGQKLLLHLDAVDWESEVFINGQSLGIHRGGYDQITHDITAWVTGSGPQELIVRVYDPTDNYGQPRGKQTLYPGGIMYTSCSGIWQSIWLEPVPTTSIDDLKLVPDVDSNRLKLTVNVSGPTSGVRVMAVASDGTNVVGSISGASGVELLLPIPSPILWSPTRPFLYDLKITLSNGPARLDTVTSYFGMRKVSIGMVGGFVKMLLNDEFIFQFGPLDQGFWPDGIYTAPTDDALKSDIEQAKLFGYNMIRKHIKVEPARWYYWADQLGMLVWQDMPSLNSYTGNPQPIDAPQFEAELVRMVETHQNHPSIISWVVFNESQGQHDTESLVATVQGMDPTRLVNQGSGGGHFGVGEILDDHAYPNPTYPVSASQAVVCGEFGGLGLSVSNHIWAPGWGYGELLSDVEKLAAGFEGFCIQLSDFVENHGLSGAVYTEITDVEIELNGFLTYDRKVRKLDPDRIRAAIALANSPISVTPVVPTSENVGQPWKYRFDQPSSGWIGTTYNDSTGNWTVGPGGFGSGEPPQTSGYARTPWTTSDIWLRRTFNPGSLTPEQISNLYFSVFNDEGVEIYINGTLAASATGYRTSYGLLELTPEGRAAIIPNANNLMAVHCHQTLGGQYIDVGLSVVQTSVSIPSRPVPPIPTGLKAASGAFGVSLGWAASSEAVDYTVKRSTISGGPYTDLVLTSPINSISDASASNGTTYYYVVSASNASGQSADSAEVSVTVAIPTPPPPAVVAWFKPETLSGLAEGQAVAFWPDSSSSGYAATQAISNRRPTYLSSAINGLPAVHFNGAEDSYLAFTRPVENDFTIFCVYRSSQGVNPWENFWDGAGLVSGEMPNPVNDFGLSLNANGRLLAGTGGPDVTIASDSGFNDGQPHRVVFKRIRRTGALALYVDGLLQDTGTGGQQPLTAPRQLTLGAHPSLVNYLTGDIAEVKIFDAALTDSDRMAEEAALSCKYGLGAGDPPATPSGLTASAGNRQATVGWMKVVGATGYKLNHSLHLGGPFTQRSGNLTLNSFVDTAAVAGRTNYYQVASFSACGTSSYSPVVGVLVPLPILEARASNGGLMISWPAWASDWMLWSATSLSPPVAWSPVTNSVVSTNGFFQVSVDTKSDVEFYQLTSP